MKTNLVLKVFFDQKGSNIVKKPASTLDLDLQSEHTLHYMEAGMLRQVEVEAQSTRLIEISWILTFRVSTPYIT